MEPGIQQKQSRDATVPLRCYYYSRGYCRFGARCKYIHELEISNYADETIQNVSSGNSCTFRNGLYLRKDKRKYNFENIDALKDLSRDKTCGVCFEEVISIRGKDNKFGILPNCNHCFCYTCIKTWRNSIDFDADLTKRCPECRIASNYVYKSSLWFDQEEKQKFIERHNTKLSSIDCKFFRKGKGRCRFGNLCLFRHALPNGQLLDVGPPQSRLRNDSSLNFLRELHEEMFAWEYDEAFELNWFDMFSLDSNELSDDSDSIYGFLD